MGLVMGRTRVGGQEGLKLLGEAGYETAVVLEQAFLQFLAAGHLNLILDLGFLDYADGGMVRALHVAAEELSPAGELRLLNPNAEVRRLLDLAGCGSYVEHDRTARDGPLEEVVRGAA